MYSFGTSTPKWTGRIFLNVVVLNSFLHVFESDTVVRPLPLLCVWFVVSLDEMHVWLKICRSSGWSVCWLVVMTF